MKPFIRFFLATCFLLQSISGFPQSGTVAGWNYYQTFSGTVQPGKKYPALVFMPGTGEVGTSVSRLVSNGPHRFIIDGGNPLPGWFVISLQPPSVWPNEAQIKIRLDSLKLLFPLIDTTRINLTGLSMGGWCSSTFVTADPYGGPYTYAGYINTIVTVQGVIPDDNQPYPNLFDNFALSGGQLLNFEQRLDRRGGDAVVNRMNATAPGSATFIETNFGGGGHCCWANFYGGGSLQPARFAALGNLNMYEWLIAKNAHNVVSLPNTPQPAPVNQVTEFKQVGNYLHFNAKGKGNYNMYNVQGQRLITNSYKMGNNKIFIGFMPSGVYYLQCLYNTFKFIIY